MEAFEQLKEYRINLVVLGDGRDKQRILEIIEKKGISDKFYFLGSYPPENMPEFFVCADALLITLKKADIFSYTIPGKLQSYLACAKPIIGALDGIGKEIKVKIRTLYKRRKFSPISKRNFETFKNV